MSQDPKIHDLRIYAEGAAFSDGIYDLRALETVVTCQRQILDRLIAVQIGKRQIPKDLKNQISYNTKIKSGSIELLIDLLVEHREYIAIFAAHEGVRFAQQIVQLLSDAIDLRKMAASFKKLGLPININITNSFNIASPNNSVNVIGNDRTGEISINDPKILWAAQSTRTPINQLLQRVDGISIEHLDITAGQADLSLTPADRFISGVDKEELPTTLSIIGRLDMVAFSSHKGAIVSENERFNVTWDSSIRTKMQQIADVEGIVFKVNPIIDRKTLQNTAIGFHVLDCRNPQIKLDV